MAELTSYALADTFRSLLSGTLSGGVYMHLLRTAVGHLATVAFPDNVVISRAGSNVYLLGKKWKATEKPLELELLS